MNKNLILQQLVYVLEKKNVSIKLPKAILGQPLMD